MDLYFTCNIYLIKKRLQDNKLFVVVNMVIMHMAYGNQTLLIMMYQIKAIQHKQGYGD